HEDRQALQGDRRPGRQAEPRSTPRRRRGAEAHRRDRPRCPRQAPEKDQRGQGGPGRDAPQGGRQVMRRYVSVTLLFAALAALVGAQGPATLAPADQARLLRRNQKLLEATVASSLDLSDKVSPLDRAGACNKLVKVWAGEVEQAVRDRDGARAAEMGGHLQK